MPKKIKINKKKDTVFTPVASVEIPEASSLGPTHEQPILVIPDVQLEAEEASSQESDEIDFEEEVRKVIGLRNATQNPQYISKKRTTTTQETPVIQFVEPLQTKSGFVAGSSVKPLPPVGARNNSLPSRR